eukprot:COSAG05_NODE_5350_length_1199_cov_9.807273_1_plen_244_part_00
MPIAAVSWGGGGFTVQQAGSLSLANMAVGGKITVQGGGSLSVSGGMVDGKVTVASGATLHMLAGVILLPSQITADAQATVTRDTSPSAIAAQCLTLLAHNYTTLRNSWRSTGTEDDKHGDCSSGTGVGGGRWYRFAGAGGDALPLTPPGYRHCGTGFPGWLSGWATPQGGGDPPNTYSGAGRYPAAAEGVVESTVCFDDGSSSNYRCYRHVQVGVVRCGGFLLWRLPDAPNCNLGYCTAASGL